MIVKKIKADKNRLNLYEVLLEWILSKFGVLTIFTREFHKEKFEEWDGDSSMGGELYSWTETWIETTRTYKRKKNYEYRRI